jgi:RNA polymerase sigma-70 factor (ECF subfamily)
MGLEPFETVVAMHHDEIYRYLRRTTARAAEADDLSQETFLRAYRAWRVLPADANVRAWLFAIATNLARNHFRSEGRRRRAHDTVRALGDEVDADGPEGMTIFNETRGLVEAAVVRLPAKQRLAFILRKVHDLDYDTIAQSLECSADSARAHVFQALRKIRRQLDGHLSPTERSDDA